MDELINISTVDGIYDELEVEMSSDPVSVFLIDDLSITKEADKEGWVSGPLTYTITIENDTEEDFETPILTDIIDPTLATLIDESITIDDVPIDEEDFTFDDVTGLLTITLPAVDSESTMVIKFQVERI